jgi:hypothetical protein
MLMLTDRKSALAAPEGSGNRDKTSMLSNFFIVMRSDSGSYSQHFIFFVTYECTQKARVFVTIKPYQPIVI